MESAKYAIKEAVQAIQKLDFGKNTCNINQYIRKRTQNNDIFEIIKARYFTGCISHALKFSSTSVSVERSFSMLKKLLAKDRNFKIENVRH